MNSKECMLKEFGNRFDIYKDKNIVFYLKQFNPTPYFVKYPDYKFIGIMDNYTNSGHAFDKEILSFERAAKLQTELIIIASESVYYEVIRRRIAGFCRQNHIQLFTIDGAKLSLDSGVAYRESVYFNLNAQLLRKKIDACKTISFNIYDTLLMKQVLTDADMYGLMEVKIRKKEGLDIDFSKIRIRSQKELEEAGAYVTLEQVYKRIQAVTGISSDCAGRLLEMEQDFRKKLTIPRSEMLELFYYAVRKGKKVFLAEDGCLSRRELENLLHEHGITGYDKMLLSCEEKKSCLYRKLIKYADGSILHIGTIYETDMYLPKGAAIDVCRILRAEDMLQISVYGGKKYDSSLYERIKLGLFAARLFNSPFALCQTNGRGRISETEDIAYLFVAPLVMDFMFWFVKRMKEDGIGDILFGARDGYLVEKLYRMMTQHFALGDYPPGTYFWTSRLVCTVSGLFTAEDIKKTCKDPYNGNAEQLLAERYMLEKEDILPFEEEKYADEQQYILCHTEKILKKAAQIRNQYLLYGKKCGIPSGKKTAFFDFVASGTCQKSLEKLFQKKLYGYYFYRLFSEDKDKSALEISSYIGQNVRIEENSLFMECIFTSPDPAVAAVGESGNPVFAKENRNNEEIRYCERLQKGIFDYAEQMMILTEDLTEAGTERTDESFLEYLYPDYTIIENDLFHNYVVKDEFIGCESHIGRLYRY